MKKRIRGNRPPNRHARIRAMYRPSTYIRHLSEVSADTPVWLWCRVSSDAQAANGNNADQETDLRAAVEARGGVVLGVRRYTGKASGDLHEAALNEAARLAAATGAVLVAESTSRFARHPDFNPKDSRPRKPGYEQLDDLRWVCGDVPLVTLHEPDSTWQEERGRQSERGQRQKGNRGGRPTKPKPGYKKQRRLQEEPKVRWMKRVGMSNRAIARELDIAESTLRLWVRSFL